MYKWLFIGLAVLMVIAITIGATLFFTRDGSGPGGTTTTAGPPNTSDIASVNDTGPVAIITSEPTCAGWRTVQSMLAAAESNGWGQRDASSESSSWTPQVRAQYEAVGSAMRSAAEQVVALAKQTPHRVMREMYEQFIAYGRAYADSLSSYEPKDDLLSLVNVYFDDSIGGVCNAIDPGGIATHARPVPAAQPPGGFPPVGDVSDPVVFITAPSTHCSEWMESTTAVEVRLADWQRLDPAVLASAWTAEQRAVAEQAARTFDSWATSLEKIGRQETGEFQDFASFAAVYLRAYAAALPTYTTYDSYASTPSLRLINAVTTACKVAVG